MEQILFFSCIFLEFITMISLIFSHFFYQDRIWPPITQKSWQQYLMLFLFNSTAIFIILLGLIDWGSDDFPNWFFLPGLIAWILGNVFSIWALSHLGLKSTSGIPGEFIKDGPYKYSRNPQYTGFILSLFGWALITKSVITLIVSFSACIPLLIVPFVEEPWLLSSYGEDYREYMKTVPRFLIWK
jgi:protein-S-isoprenylcysteine O-methyltransferase Ste14